MGRISATVWPVNAVATFAAMPTEEARHDVRRALTRELAHLTPQQPATVAWRVVEVERVLGRRLPTGLGLDVGCGDGTIATLLRRHGAEWRLVGVDPDPEEARLAEECGVYERVHVTSAAAVPEADASFDFAFSNSVIEHISELPAVLREVARVLKPGAPLVATVPSAELHACLRGPGLLAPALGRSRAEYLRGLDDRTAHVTLWTSERWQDELARAGFARVQLEPYLTRAEVRRWERLSNWTGGVAWALAGRQQHPLTVSRRMGLQTGSPRSRALGSVCEALVRAALAGAARGSNAAGYGCLLVTATRA